MCSGISFVSWQINLYTDNSPPSGKSHQNTGNKGSGKKGPPKKD